MSAINLPLLRRLVDDLDRAAKDFPDAMLYLTRGETRRRYWMGSEESKAQQRFTELSEHIGCLLPGEAHPLERFAAMLDGEPDAQSRPVHEWTEARSGEVEYRTQLNAFKWAAAALERFIQNENGDPRAHCGMGRMDDWMPDAPPPLAGTAALVYEMLMALPPHRSMTAKTIADELADKHELIIDESSIRKNILPQLKAYGLDHYPRKGYRIQKSA